jgi:hypothetical protein
VDWKLAPAFSSNFGNLVFKRLKSVSENYYE